MLQRTQLDKTMSTSNNHEPTPHDGPPLYHDWCTITKQLKISLKFNYIQDYKENKNYIMMAFLTFTYYRRFLYRKLEKANHTKNLGTWALDQVAISNCLRINLDGVLIKYSNEDISNNTREPLFLFFSKMS